MEEGWNGEIGEKKGWEKIKKVKGDPKQLELLCGAREGKWG